MGNVQIVTDSNCHLPTALCNELNIHVVQLPYVWDGVTYLDEVDMSPREFYSRLRRSGTLPTTSAPTPGSFLDVYKGLIRSGDPVLVIHVGSEFSSTFKTAQLAREMLADGDVRIFDSHSNALGLGFQVLAAARAAREGAGLDEVVTVAEQARRSTGVFFAVEDIQYLHRGGRINFGQRILASLLGVIPMMQIENGPILLVARARTSTKVTSKLIQAVRDRIRDDGPVRVGVLHADNEGRAFELRRAVEQEINPDELLLEELSPILGIHTGPGALGLAYCVGV